MISCRVLLCIIGTSITGATFSAELDFDKLARECASWVAPGTLAAIAKTESNYRQFAIGVNNGRPLAQQPKTREEAISVARRLIGAGHSIDVGLAQINSSNLRKLGISLEEAFDPCTNLATGARILAENFALASRSTDDAQRALRKALSAYNTGSLEKGFTNGYVNKVIGNAVNGKPAEKASVSTKSVPVGVDIRNYKPVDVYNIDDHNVMVY